MPKASRATRARQTQVTPAQLARMARAREAVTVPPIRYPPDLPVAEHRAEIAEAISNHQVVVVAGETGSGKTTQLPKILLDLGRGRAGQIGHTQPRRIAARAVAERISTELGSPLGEIVGYQVRFTDTSSEKTLVKVMTDGILLAQIQRDPQLLAYDTIIIDEAHERSLNIDFLLGYLARLLPTRPDLKLVITSATIDTERFAAHFSPANLARLGGAGELVASVLPAHAPIIEVTGRVYPVELRYRPLVQSEATEARDLVTAAVEACEELMLEGPGDILVFCSGERDIHDVADALSGALGPRLHDPRDPGYVEIMPLYSRLSAAEQHRVFAAHPGRRIVLATNVAETSLTVPGIRFVVDTGLARISRYSKATKVQRLPIEPVSRASANQRSGRSGRLAPGTAIRLYSEDDYNARPEFTEPEILRTSLASVLLQMIAVGVVDTPEQVARFPFVDPPDTRAVRDGVALLLELGALAGTGASGAVSLTATGRQLAALPMDPRLARMVLEGEKLGVGSEVAVIAAALSIQDVRERPADQRAQADQAHARFTDPASDFLTYLNLWEHLRSAQRELSGSAFRRLCRAEYLHFLRVREWQDLVAQIRSMAREIGLKLGSAERSGQSWPADQIHRALLAGLLSHIGMQETGEVRASSVAHLRGEARARALRQAARRARNEYLGARGARFAIFPGSALAKRPPAWIMAGELVETSRLWARDVARIDPDWIEPLAGPLARRSYANPHWSKRLGAAVCTEKVLLYGVPIVADRQVLYARIDATAAREMFIQQALVAGEWNTHHKFFAENLALLAEAEELVARSRDRRLAADEEDLFEFYDERLPEDIVSARHFDKWWRTKQRDEPQLLTLRLEDLFDLSSLDTSQYPECWPQGDLHLPLTYQLLPGEAADGVTVHIPLVQLPKVEPAGFDWLVPGMLDELCVATIRSLPKPVRVQLVPAPDTARDVATWLRANTPAWADMARAGDMAEPFSAAFTRAVLATRGVVVPRDVWTPEREARLPAHLRVHYEVTDEPDSPRILASGPSLVALQRQFAPQAASDIKAAVRESVRAAARAAPKPAAPAPPRERAQLAASERPPELARRADQAAGSIRAAEVRRLLLAENRLPTGRITSRWSPNQALTLAASPYPSTEALVEDLQLAAVIALTSPRAEVPPGTAIGPSADQIADPAAFAEASAFVRQHLEQETYRIVGDVTAALTAWRQLLSEIAATSSLSLLTTLHQVREHAGTLIREGFISQTPPRRLPHLVRYLRADSHRLVKARTNAARDTELAWRLAGLESEYAKARAVAAASAANPARAGDLAQVFWLLEELRVSLFAEQLGTDSPVSEKRIRKLLSSLVG